MFAENAVQMDIDALSFMYPLFFWRSKHMWPPSNADAADGQQHGRSLAQWSDLVKNKSPTGPLDGSEYKENKGGSV